MKYFFLLFFVTGCITIDDKTEKDRLDPDNDGVLWPDDCDDDNPEIGQLTWYLDADNDGHGNPDQFEIACDSPKEGYISNAGDCDDSNANRYPEATEVCDGIDNDCNELIDEEDTNLSTENMIVFYHDADGDGYGNVNDSFQGCIAPTNYVTNEDDCDDENSSSYPQADEFCDGMDNDCDEQIDEEPIDGETFYLDADGDGFGDINTSLRACVQPINYTYDSTDCDDSDPGLNPFDYDADGWSTCDNDCDDTDNLLNLDDDDMDGWSSCTGDCDDNSNWLNASDFDADGWSTCDNDCDDGDVFLNLSDFDGDGYDSCGTICFQFELIDSFGDGWNGAYLRIIIDSNMHSLLELEDGFLVSHTVCVPGDTVMSIYFASGDYDSEVSYNVYDDTDTLLHSMSQPTTGLQYVVGLPNVFDCDDTDASISPAAMDIGSDGIDQNCDGVDETGLCTNDCPWSDDSACDDGGPFASFAICSFGSDCSDCGTRNDNDEDGFYDDQGTTPFDTTLVLDCDDTDASIYPGAVEVVNDGIDQDCDGQN